MTQHRFKSGAILITHNPKTDVVWLADVAKEFVSRNDNRKGNFGTFIYWRWSASGPSYSQLTGLTYDRPDKGQRETFKAYFFFSTFC